MTKMLRVDDDVHEIILKFAEAEDRKITPYLNRHFRNLDKGVIPMAVEEIEGMVIPPMQQPARPKKREGFKPGTFPEIPKVITADMKPETLTKMATAGKNINQSGFCKNGHMLNRMGKCDVKGCK